MPCLYISTNVDLAGADTAAIFSAATTAISTIIGKPEKICDGAAERVGGDIVWREQGASGVRGGGVDGGINSQVKRNLISTIGAILNDKLAVPPARFFLKVHDTTAGRPISKL